MDKADEQPTIAGVGRGVEKPYAYCCNSNPDTCDCVRPNHGTAFYQSVCIIPNCRNSTPAIEPFCSKHRIEAKREWHESIGPKVAWEDVHPETREAYLARADAALPLMQPEIDRRVAEEKVKLFERLRNMPNEVADSIAKKHFVSFEVAKLIGRDIATAFQQESSDA